MNGKGWESEKKFSKLTVVPAAGFAAGNQQLTDINHLYFQKVFTQPKFDK
jgi:hypothetical protein